MNSIKWLLATIAILFASLAAAVDIDESALPINTSPAVQIVLIVVLILVGFALVFSSGLGSGSSKVAREMEKKTLIYGEHDSSALPDTPMDVVNMHLSEITKLIKDDEALEKLEIVRKLTKGVDEYCESSSVPMSSLMCRINEATRETDWDTLFENGELQFKMVVGCLSGHLEGVFLKQLASVTKASSALEIGTFTGSATLGMAEGMEAQSGTVVTLEIDPYLKKFCDPFFNEYNETQKRKAIDLRIGCAIELMKDLADDGQTFDLVFVDANKSEYATYIDILLDRNLVHNGSLIVVDNVSFKGTAWCNNGIATHMKTAKYIRAFNEKVVKDERLQQVILPIRDGVSLIEVQGLKDRTIFDKVGELVRNLSQVNVKEQLNSNGALDAFVNIFQTSEVRELMMELISWEDFEECAGSRNIDVLSATKVLRYFLNLPLGYVTYNFAALVEAFGYEREVWDALNEAVMAECASVNVQALVRSEAVMKGAYGEISKQMETKNPHLVYPTSIYQTAGGKCFSTSNSSKIEAFLSTTKTSSIRILNRVLEFESLYLRDLYKPLRRCVCVIDKTVDGHWGEQLEAYFRHHGVKLVKLSYRAHEADKHIGSVQKILEDYKRNRCKRNEPILVVGGGVITDLAGFASGLYHRGTPYIMLCTSVVSGIDAGPSPRTCCDGDGYKNLFGVFHPPVFTITDRHFFKTLRPGWLRHGISEIIKMGVVKDRVLFECVEKAGIRLVDTMFGTNCPEDTEFQTLCDLIISRAMDSYVKSEYGNLWECHQMRPHAYGHIWSPGFELPAGLLHGHAIAIGMGFGAFISRQLGWIEESEFRRVLKLFSTLEISLVHPILDNVEPIWQAQLRMIEKHGGNLAAPLPKGEIGKVGYLNDISREQLEGYLLEYRKICASYPRKGLGIEAHCVDVGLEDPRHL